MTADSDEPHSKTRHKRTRTGCMKCRTRRRKCDEGKPRCQRCVDGGFECHYGPRLTFLEKNVLTVSRAPAPPPTSTPQYVRLQFVEPGAASSTAAPDAEGHDHPTISPGSSETLAPSFYEPPVHDQKPAPEVQHPTDTGMPFPTLPGVQPWSPDSAHQLPQTPGLIAPAGTTPKPVNDTSPKDPAYETALNVLLSLGSDMPTPSFASPTAHSLATLHTSPASSAAVPTDYNLTQDRLLQLIRYYRYQVAPWLDICDMGQTFGLAVARLAVASEGTLSGLLALTSHAQQADGHSDTNDAEYLSALAEGSLLQQQGVVDIFSDQFLAQVALLNTCRFVNGIPASWQSPTNALFGEHFLAGALEHAGTKLRASILIMLLRLELSAALINGSTVSVPEQVAYIHTTQSPGRSGIDESMFRYATDALLLCARAANFCAAPFAQTQAADGGGPITPVQRWTMLNDALAAWYANRPHEFRPMAEMEGEESLFPVILFTNGAAVFANQLYHAAMLLLLQSKPRTLQAGAGAARKTSSGASQLWHAQRVCGICLNNDRRDGWDPCLVAALHLAAQKLTYEPQQRAILDCLGRVKVVTGWNLGAFAAELQEAWGMAGG